MEKKTAGNKKREKKLQETKKQASLKQGTNQEFSFFNFKSECLLQYFHFLSNNHDMPKQSLKVENFNDLFVNQPNYFENITHENSPA
jgi:hypothetical protein